jgi:hypothetical protein
MGEIDRTRGTRHRAARVPRRRRGHPRGGDRGRRPGSDRLAPPGQPVQRVDRRRLDLDRLERGRADGRRAVLGTDSSYGAAPRRRGIGRGGRGSSPRSHRCASFTGRIARVDYGGNRPSSISERRTRITSGSFIARTAAVVRPIAVRPTRQGPSQRKCRSHLVGGRRSFAFYTPAAATGRTTQPEGKGRWLDGRPSGSSGGADGPSARSRWVVRPAAGKFGRWSRLRKV